MKEFRYPCLDSIYYTTAVIACLDTVKNDERILSALPHCPLPTPYSPLLPVPAAQTLLQAKAAA